MNQRAIVPCVWLDDQAEAAAAFYVRTFPSGRVTRTSHYPEAGDNPSGRPPGSVLAVEFEVAGQRFTVLNGGPLFKVNPTISFFVHVETAAEAERLFGALADGGQPLMPLGSYPWSPRYGWIQDRYGVSWQVMAGRRQGAATIVPCLMFAGEQHGRAEESMRHYTGIFPGGKVEGLERYATGEGPTDKVKHGRFTLAGQELVAMDAHGDHGARFDEGLSLQVMCQDQAELDRLWFALSAGGEQGPCGWLKDRFGLSWQVVPEQLGAWMAAGDAAACRRVFDAMLKMGRLETAALERAFDGP